MIHPIRLYGDPVLRKRAAVVERFDADLDRLAQDMIETMHDAHGVGLAAPQIGISRRLFVAAEVVQRRAPEASDPEPSANEASVPAPKAPKTTTVDERDGQGEPDEPDEQDEPDEPDEPEPEDVIVAVHVMVNPEIVDRHGDQVGPDGCLSVPGLWIENMLRDATVRIRYQDVGGAWHDRVAEGHFAHVIQHELDHLDGVLYFDHLEADDRQRFIEAHRAELADMQRRAKAFLREARAASARPR